jgi:hypothetical protein
MESIIELDPLEEFFSAIKNPLTKDRYEKRLRMFFDFLKLEGDLSKQAKEFLKKAMQDKPEFVWATYKINEYMHFQKLRAEKGEIQESTLPNYYKPIKLFCDENNIVLNWKKISRRIPKGKRHANDRAPTREEIITILGYHDPRIKVIVLFMVSGGFRVGAWDYLKIKHVEPIESEKDGRLMAAKVKVYAGTDEEYWAFVTPEAFRAFKSWIDVRSRAGEKVTGESWILRDLWDDEEKYRGMKIARRGFASAPKKLTSVGVRRLIERALVAQGIRKEKLGKGQRRYEFQADHGFRKLFKSICERKMKSLHVEILLGHNVGLADNYYRPQESELLEEYLKAVPDLTILEPKASSEAVSEDIAALKRQVQELEQSIQFATRQNITKEIRSCLRNYFGAISQEEKQRQKARLLQGFGFTEEEIEEIERLHNAVYEELKIPSHVKDKETYLSEQFRRIGERPKLKELFTDYFMKINEVTERVYQMTKSRTSGQANFFEFAKEDINQLFP